MSCVDRLDRTQPNDAIAVALVQDIGGYDVQKQEIREAVELPLTHSDLYRQIGIDPPRGVLLYGPPGTGKTMLAKAVAHHTTAGFIRVVGSEFVQKYLGEVSAWAMAGSSLCKVVNELCAIHAASGQGTRQAEQHYQAADSPACRGAVAGWLVIEPRQSCRAELLDVG